MNKNRYYVNKSSGVALTVALLALISCNFLSAVAGTDKSSNPTQSPSVPPPTDFPEGSIPSPDGAQSAYIDQGNRLILIDPFGREKELVRAETITHLSWFPGSQHIAYSVRVSSGEAFPNYEFHIFIVSTVSGDTKEIATGFAPVVSPNGNKIAFLQGGWVGDACIVGFGLGVVLLDDKLQPSSLLRQQEIIGIPFSEEYESFHPDLRGNFEFPGMWRSDSKVEVAMRWACKMDDPGNGVYLIDIDTLKAEKVAELPQD